MRYDKTWCTVYAGTYARRHQRVDVGGFAPPPSACAETTLGWQIYAAWDLGKDDGPIYLQRALDYAL
jgi:hypothetical protein